MLGGPARPAFTLIELLVVISIIAILAGILLPAAMGVKNKAALKRVEGELGRVEQAIATYKIDKGFYPPDNKEGNKPVLPVPNALYYELGGAVYDKNSDLFTPLLGGNPVLSADLNTTFHTRGINNAGIDDGGEGPRAKAYITDLKPNQHGKTVSGLEVIGTTVDGPLMYNTINPFRYVSTNPTNNPSSFDLWVDVIVAGRTNRISNWSDQPEIVAY